MFVIVVRGQEKHVWANELQDDFLVATLWNQGWDADEVAVYYCDYPRPKLLRVLRENLGSSWAVTKDNHLAIGVLVPQPDLPAKKQPKDGDDPNAPEFQPQPQPPVFNVLGSWPTRRVVSWGHDVEGQFLGNKLDVG